MTFTEAAIEVLRLVGKPLHYKTITELAIQKNLLSHVGKTPEVTMASRLATFVKKDRGESPIIKVKPGVFGLRDFTAEVIAQAESEPSDEPEIELPEEDDDAPAAPGVEAVAAPEVKKPSKPLPGSDVFPEEDDDDLPILGRPPEKAEKAVAAPGAERPAGAAPAGDDDADERRGRRRRRRRGRGDAPEGREAPEVRAAAPAEPVAELRGPRPERDRGPDRTERDRDRNGERGERADRGDRGDRGAPREDVPRGDWNREHGDGELVGKELADAVFAVLQQGDRQPTSFVRIADLLVRKDRLKGEPAALVPTVAAAVRADIARRESEAQRVRFRVASGRVSLTDWALPPEAIRFEQDAQRAADRQRDQVRQAFLRRVRELPAAGFAELLATWLNAEGVVSLRAVRRPGAQPGELHLAGTLKRGLDETRIAIVARRDGRETGRERVIEMRGAMHHYGSASAAWVITLGPVLSGAREEAAVPGQIPVSLFDGIGVARAMERAGVGLRRHAVTLVGLDVELLEVLRGDAPRVEPREDRPREGRRDERPRDDRDRDRDRGRSGPRPPLSEGAPAPAADEASEQRVEPAEGSRAEPTQLAEGQAEAPTEELVEGGESVVAPAAPPSEDDGNDEGDDDEDLEIVAPAASTDDEADEDEDDDSSEDSDESEDEG